MGSVGRRGGFAPSLLALVLLFRLLIPSGYMIAPDQAGRLGLALCGVPAEAAARSASHGGHDAHPADSAPSRPGEAPCPFAAVSAPPLPPEPPTLAPRGPVSSVSQDPTPHRDHPRVARAAPPPPATGPPATV